MGKPKHDKPGYQRGLEKFVHAIGGIERRTPEFRTVSHLLVDYWDRFQAEGWRWFDEKPCAPPDQALEALFEISKSDPIESLDLFQQMRTRLDELHERTVAEWIRYREAVDGYSELIMLRDTEHDEYFPTPALGDGQHSSLTEEEVAALVVRSKVPPGFQPHWPNGDWLFPGIIFAELRRNYTESSDSETERVLNTTGFSEDRTTIKEIQCVVERCAKSIEDYLQAVSRFAQEPMRYGWFQSADLHAACMELRTLALEWERSRDAMTQMGQSKNHGGGRKKERAFQFKDPAIEARKRIVKEALSEGEKDVPQLAALLSKQVKATKVTSNESARKWIEGLPKDHRKNIVPARKGRPAGSKNKIRK